MRPTAIRTKFNKKDKLQPLHLYLLLTLGILSALLLTTNRLNTYYEYRLEQITNQHNLIKYGNFGNYPQ